MALPPEPGDRWSVSLFGNNLTDKQYEAGNLYQFLKGSLGLRNGVFPEVRPSVGFMPTRAHTEWRRLSGSSSP